MVSSLGPLGAPCSWALLACIVCDGVQHVSSLSVPPNSRVSQEAASNIEYSFARDAVEGKPPYLTYKQIQESAKVWFDDYSRSSSWVDSLVVEPATSTDRVAITVVPPSSPEKLSLMAHIIKINMHRLGPKWALQIFHCNDANKDALNELIGKPKNVIWSPVLLDGVRSDLPSVPTYSKFMLGTDLWSRIPDQYEHILIFQDDSIILRSGCVEKYLDYDYVGAPWSPKLWTPYGPMLSYGGNGGLRLSRRSSSLAAVSGPLCAEIKRNGKPKKWHNDHEDYVFVRLIENMNGTFPSMSDASGFCVETIMHPSPCAVHKPWGYQTAANMLTLLGSADGYGTEY